MASISDPEKTTPAGGRPLALDDAPPSRLGRENDVTEAEDDFQPPDGGLLAWSQVLAGVFINMMSWGFPSTFGVYQLYYRETLKLPDSQVSWIGSLQVFLAFAMCTFSGRLADAGYLKSTILGGAFLVVFGTFMTSLCTQYWQILLAQGLCTGLGLGIMFMPPVSVITSYFQTRKASALAISATGTGFGSVLFPATVNYLTPKIGFGWAVRCAAFEAMVLTVLALLLLRPQLTPRKAGPLIEWSAFREGPYLLYIFGAFLFFCGQYFGFFYINAYARNVIGFSTTDSVQLLLITNGMSVPGRPVAGYLADRHFGAVNMYIVHMMVLGGLILAWIGVTTRTGMYVFSVFFGFANGAAQGLFAGSLATLTKDPTKMGTRFGMVCTIVAFGALAGPPIAGAIIDRSGGNYLGGQLWAGLVILLGAFVIAGSRCAVTGLRLRVKI